MTSMRVSNMAIVGALLTCLSMQGCARRHKAPTDTTAAPQARLSQVGQAPPWVPTPTVAQRQLLEAPLDAPVHVPAQRTYPDLSRFTFLASSPVELDDMMAFARLTNQTLEESPLLYVFRSGPETLANVVALYGPDPAPYPDPWKRVAWGKDRPPELVDALPQDQARQLMDKARGASPAEALELLKQAAAKAPSVPGVQAALSDAALAAGDDAAAEAAARAALKLDPRFAQAHRALAEVHLRRGHNELARASLAKALALYPAYERAWQLVDVAMGSKRPRNPGIPQPFIEVNAEGAVVVVSCDRPLCEAYAACKAAFRHEPAFRGSILNEPVSVPYHLSVTEEVTCLQAGLGAHMDAQQVETEQPAPSDPLAESLVLLAEEEGLGAYAMFEIVGRHRPEWMRLAPEPEHRAVVKYVLERVLRERDPAHDAREGEGTTAMLSAGAELKRLAHLR